MLHFTKNMLKLFAAVFSVLAISFTLSGCFFDHDKPSEEPVHIMTDQDKTQVETPEIDPTQAAQPVAEPEGRIGNELTGYITLPNKWTGIAVDEWKFPVPNTAAGTYAVKPTTLTHVNDLNDDIYMKAMSVELALFPAQDFAAALSLMHEENPDFYVEPTLEEISFNSLNGWALKYRLPSGAIEVQNIVIPSPVDENACFILTSYAPKNGTYEIYEDLTSWSLEP